MSAVRPMPMPALHWSVDYLDGSPDDALALPDTLAVIGFGSRAPVRDDPRYLRVALEPHGTAPLEVWRGSGPVLRGRDGDVAWAEDGALQFGAIELDERDGEQGQSDIESTADRLYRRLLEFLEQRGYPHLLRVWNYLDGITIGEGDEERYRQFCVGRARGLGGHVDTQTLPAATAIGRVDGARRLQVYWLAARVPGTPLENPRQISAYRYPRQYGPQPPSFARAMLPPVNSTMPLMLSGTAAIVGHESQHAGSVVTQLDETLANFDSLLAAARAQRPTLPAHFGPQSRLKVYVRNDDELEQVTRELDARLGPDVPRVVLHAAVCRRELRVEIDGVHA
ncbi:pteridine-dependent deoxygenase [Lysobacter sp. LF1]|uniref:Pteridine-dependent deoxygenase n=1 Tax=Lysobacter stagni TaxID=3045172 RepID=A0ABT6XDS5_9GAMM|nr:pteridine-dependent deoxygenase [Lysobacter sp. LF1]MDI9238292.1 pteridine-dependent deoxygenase [Lysobacter sp. LF1]